MSNKKKRNPKRRRVPGTITRRPSEHDRACVVAGDNSDPVVAVGYRQRKVGADDSGFTVYTTSAPDYPEELTLDEYADVHKTFCFGCMTKNHPEAARGLTLARAYGFAWWDDKDGWIARDEDGNDVLFESGDDPIPGQMTVEEVLQETGQDAEWPTE